MRWADVSSGFFEFVDQPLDGYFGVRIIMLRVSADELDALPVILDGLLPIASRLINHTEPIVAVVRVREAH